METILFKIIINPEHGGFAQASNFISKIVSNKTIELKEVTGISSLFLKEIGDTTYKEMAKCAVNGLGKFKVINNPHNLQGITEKYRIIYCFWVKEDSLLDTVDWQYDFLIKKYFISCEIFTVIHGTRAMYHSVSHYLYDINYKYNEIYNSIFFADKELGNMELIRLQRQNVGAFHSFVPLHFFTERENELFEQIDNFFTVDELKKICVKDFVLDKSPVIKGACDFLKKALLKYSVKERESILEYIIRGNMFTFLIFAYFMGMQDAKTKEKITDLKVLYSKIREYAVGCEQLVENAIHHSTMKSGVISIRLHKEKLEYINSRYNVNEEDAPYLEVLITDYSGINKKGNIADTFISAMRLEGITDDFNNLEPCDFFEINNEDCRLRKIKDAFEHYYTSSENIGKHLGLKIFKGIVEENGGTFGVYSHRNHLIRNGENCDFIENHRSGSENVFPGTGYRMLFSLKRERKEITRAEVAVDYNMYLEENVESYRTNYICNDFAFDKEFFIYQNQKEKEEKIYQLSQTLDEDRISEGKRKINYVSVENMEKNNAECIAKSLMMAGSRSRIPDYVLYNCTEDFITIFQRTMAIYFGMKEVGLCYRGREFVIALYSVEPMTSCFVVPGNFYKTLWINRRNGYAGNSRQEIGWLLSALSLYKDENSDFINDIPPYDILHELDYEKGKCTLFEKYTLETLESNIQERRFGCKIQGTHMRLGSTIHIDCFYEAELLFSDRLFTSRFAYLLVKSICLNENFIKAKDVTLYSYALYSETLVFEILNILQVLYPEKDIDYAILEREAEHRKTGHMDRIRYSTVFNSEEEQKNHFRDRKIICIVPVNSTLKTHEKLISLLCAQNPVVTKQNFISNYAIILVGSKGENRYWEINEKNRTFDNVSLEITPIPQYFILVKVQYYEALTCDLCFPENPLDETPLVEVNAASTIPNQSFGLYNNAKMSLISYEDICKEEEKIGILKNSLIYLHTQRGENHYLYYFKTDNLFLREKAKIEDWLVNEIKPKVEVEGEEYHILFSPAHFSNAGFLELVNKSIFHDAALVIRVDVDKEFRSNICTKYSNLAAFVGLLEERGKEQNTVIKVYYVDDSIISGRTFFRAKNLISSVLEEYKLRSGCNSIKIHIFEKIFVLLDRNSKQHQLQYVECWDGEFKTEECLRNHYFAFRNLNISSMRNHGDSCVLCQLERDSSELARSSVTWKMNRYWEETERKFGIHLINERSKENEQQHDKEAKDSKKEKAFRRMFCAHLLSKEMSASNHGNRKEEALRLFLHLLITDYLGRLDDVSGGSKNKRKEMAFEYLLSYLKIASRPFLVFDKTIKEVVFDVLLVLAEGVLTTQKAEFVLQSTNKDYLKQEADLFRQLLDEIINEGLTKKQKCDLLLLLMKQLTEMKSNYFIRSENMVKMFEFMNKQVDDKKEEITRQYLQQTKKVLGLSSDTSKSAWFDKELLENHEKLSNELDIFKELVLENTRTYFDGIEKLSKRYAASMQLNGRDILNRTEDDDFKSWLIKELLKAQYRDFTFVLKNMGMISERTDQERDIESNALWAALNMYILCQEKEHRGGKIEETCNAVAYFMKQIVGAKNVKIVLEYPMQCEQWKEEICNFYNELVKKHVSGDIPNETLRMEVLGRKEYLVVADSEAMTAEIKDAGLQFMERLKSYHDSASAKEVGFQLDIEKKDFVWELEGEGAEQESRQILIYMQFHEIKIPDIWYRLRNLICMRYLLNRTVFDIDVRDYLYELILADREGLMYNYDKAYSHTAEAVKRVHLQKARLASESNEPYQSFVLTLLSDNMVSRIYKKSLKKDFYCRNVSVRCKKLSDVLGMFEKRESIIVVDKDDYASKVVLTVEVKKREEMNWNQEVITVEKCNGEDDLFLLLLPLITNVAEPERGLKKDGKVAVFLACRDGYLFIENQCIYDNETMVKVKEINENLNFPPTLDRGISLWSMSRYIKSMLSSLAMRRMTFLAGVLKENTDEKKKKAILKKLKKDIGEIIDGDKFDVKVEVMPEEEDKYNFCVRLPIMASIYENWLKEGE